MEYLPKLNPAEAFTRLDWENHDLFGRNSIAEFTDQDQLIRFNSSRDVFGSDDECFSVRNLATYFWKSHHWWTDLVTLRWLRSCLNLKS